MFTKTYIAEPKFDNIANENRKLLKWSEEFYILLRILSFKMFTWFMESKDCSGCGYFSPDFYEYKLSLFWSGHFGLEMENKTDIYMF